MVRARPAPASSSSSCPLYTMKPLLMWVFSAGAGIALEGAAAQVVGVYDDRPVPALDLEPDIRPPRCEMAPRLFHGA